MANEPREVDRTKNARQELARRHIVRTLRQYTDGMTAGQINAARDPSMSYIRYQDVAGALNEMEEEGSVVCEKYVWKIPRKPGFWAAIGRLLGF